MSFQATHGDVEFEFADAAKLGNKLLKYLDDLREVDPIFWSERNRCWIITAHENVIEGFRGNLPLSNHYLHYAFEELSADDRRTRIPYFLESIPNWLIQMDPPDQSRLRRLMIKAFSSPKVIENLRPVARRFIQEALDDAAKTDVVDYLTVVARKIPARIIVHLMGLNDEFLVPLRRWSDTMNEVLGSFSPPTELLDRTERTMLEMRAKFLPEIEKRRANPTGDFISTLVTARDQGDRLSEEEILATCYLSILGGNDSIGSTIALGTVALAENPSVADHIREHPDNILNVIMELQRYISMSTAMRRVVSSDFTWDGRQLRKGQIVLLVIASANRDPRSFPEPLRIDPLRKQDKNVTFAPGLHFCIGHLLAKMQLTEFFPQLVRRFDIAVESSQLEFSSNFAVRSLKTLSVRLKSRVH
jgi:cytochrome P450